MENNKKNIARPDKKFKTTNIKGKEYVDVKERIKYLAFDFQGDYSIETSYKYYPESKLWVVKAWLTLVQNGFKSIYTGHGQEIESDSYKDVNHTSALENAETSAVGRACAMAGIGVDVSIASTDEINKATNRSAPPATELATIEQKNQIKLLVKNDLITPLEEEKALAMVTPDLTFDAANQAINILHSRIEKRKTTTS